MLCLALASAADAVVEDDEEGGGVSSSERPENPAGEEGSDFLSDDLLFSGSYDFTIKAWSLRTLSRVKTLSGHADAVRSLLYVAPRKKEEGSSTRNRLGKRGRLFSASYDGTVRVWDVATLSPIATLPGHSGPVRTLAAVDGLVFSGSYDKTVSKEKKFFYFSTSTSTTMKFFFSFSHLSSFSSENKKRQKKNRFAPGTPTRSTRRPASRATRLQ